MVNEQVVEGFLGGPYLTVSRRWSPGDRLQMSSDMPVRVLKPHWRADAVRGCRAVQRGPLVYCLESDDLGGGAIIEDVALDATKPLRAVGEVPKELEGYVSVAVLATGERVGAARARLYEQDERADVVEVVPLTLVPYFARSNRASPAMRVWVPASKQYKEELGGNRPS